MVAEQWLESITDPVKVKAQPNFITKIDGVPTRFGSEPAVCKTSGADDKHNRRRGQG